ncbi:cytochrome P450 [Suillus subluteus]|nr:cytochrome P450 [Suillus subluteus]
MLTSTDVTWLDLCFSWLTFAEWGKKYGDISHVEVLGQHIIVLNSVKSAVDMLDKKGTVYSDRPVLPIGGELVGWKHALGLLPFDDRLRQFRKSMHQVIGNRTALGVYHPIEEIETRRFLKRALLNPETLRAHVRHTTGAIILRITRGYEARRTTIHLSTLQTALWTNFRVANVPEWFPGAGFKRLAREWSKTGEHIAAIPYKFVKDQMVINIYSFTIMSQTFHRLLTLPTSFTSNLLEGRTLSAEEDDMVMWSAASLYAGGADTKKAQAEIDAIVDLDRLPSFADRDCLPYTEALVKEIHHWNVVGPTVSITQLTAIPHHVTEDDIHDGYYIPKGSLAIANICICPGLHLADASVWVSNVMSLAVFDISKVVEKGVEVTPEVDHTSGTVRYVVHLIASAVLVLIDVLPAIPNPSSALLSLAPKMPLRSFSRMLTIKVTQMILVI